MSLFETIQIKNGIPQRLEYHNERMNRSRNDLFCLSEEIYLENLIIVPQKFSKGIVKCRVEYAEQIEKVEFKDYHPQQHDAFYLVDSSIDYAHKYTDRKDFKKLKYSLPLSSEIIIIKDGFITDTSYSNLIFKNKKGKWCTPETFLLKGTQREYLLDERIIFERTISKYDLQNFSHFMMINAMLDIKEARAIPIDRIIQ